MRTRSLTVALTVAVAVASGITACGAGAEPGRDQGADGGSSPALQRADVRVGLTEWTIVVSRSHVPSGRLTVAVTNTGATVHDLVVSGALGTWETPDLPPGEESDLVVRAAPNETLHLWCSMPGHRMQGMHAALITSQSRAMATTGRRP